MKGEEDTFRNPPPRGAAAEGSAPRVNHEDTIVAISTPAGASARGIVRLSGPDAVALSATLFRGSDVDAAGTYVALSGRLELGSDWPAVPAIIYVMRRPASYTREDVVEMHVPGSPAILGEALRCLLRAGARAAGPGEFTRRAFLNGRIDLAQAEGVKRIIHARSEAEMRVALRQAGGGLSREIEGLRDGVMGILAQVEAAIDFSDQEIELLTRDGIAGLIAAARARLRAVVAGGVTGRVLGELPRVAFCGAQNAGKSALFNRLLQRERAIVSPVAGTTRDVIEARALIGGVEVILADAAGAAAVRSELEGKAAALARRSAESADIVVFVLDASAPAETPDADMMNVLRRRDPSGTVACLNKSDLPALVGEKDARVMLGLDADATVVRACALSRDGVDELSGAISAKLLSGRVERSAAQFVLEARQRAALDEADAALERGGRAPDYEFVSLELREALHCLDELLGRHWRIAAGGDGRPRYVDTSVEILDRIFSQFCIGK